FADGLEETVWNPAHRDWLLELKQGDAIQVGVDSKGKSHVIEPPDELSGQAQPDAIQREIPFEPPASKLRVEMEHYIAANCRMWQYIWKQVQQTLGSHNLSEESYRAIATSIYIQTHRKFSEL
ncbi:MAG: hypothetical protein AAGF24_01110, partial [Cyanobacteria bacterium P01_H01_bin.121]